VQRLPVRAIRLWTRFRSDQRGLTLVELLVTIVLFAFVLTALLNTFDFAQSQAPKDIEYSHAIGDATAGLAQMTRELRDAYRIGDTDGNPSSGVGTEISFFAQLNDVDTEVEYGCDYPSLSNPTNNNYHSCRRVSAPDGSALPSLNPCGTGCAVIIDRVHSSNVFTFIGSTGTPNPVYPTYVQENVSVPAAGPLTNGLTHFIALSNGTAIPNLQDGQ
jgi:prepilin-type N-terminal cleavage/methylation domain-containing protein